LTFIPRKPGEAMGKFGTEKLHELMLQRITIAKE
jgi:hypothetical protein